MTYHYARNIQWGSLESTDVLSVTFDIYDESENLIDSNQSVTGKPDKIQQLIIDKVKSRSATIALYEEIKKNEEFAIEMTT